MGDRRIQGLDGLRGVAALTVVLTHALITFPGLWSVTNGGTTTNPLVSALVHSPLYLAWAGHEAVMLFFVLSGFVLAIPFVDEHAPTYGAFVIRRIWRVFVPYLVVTAAAAAVANAIAGQPFDQLSGWFNSQWNRQATAGDVFDILRMSGSAGDVFNVPSWSLVYEVRLSLILPALALVARRLSWPVAGALSVGLAVAAGWAMGASGVLEPSLDIQYAGLFLAGATLARHRQAVVARWSRLPVLGRMGIILAGFVLYLDNWVLGFPQLGMWRSLLDVPVSAGACIFLTAALAEPGVRKVLMTKPCHWLGRVSFSLYLCHGPVLLVLVHTVGRATNPVVAVVMFPAIAFLVAEVVHRTLEEPSRRMGKHLAARLGRSNTMSSAAMLNSVELVADGV